MHWGGVITTPLTIIAAVILYEWTYRYYDNEVFIHYVFLAIKKKNDNFLTVELLKLMKISW